MLRGILKILHVVILDSAEQLTLTQKMNNCWIPVAYRNLCSYAMWCCCNN